MRVVVAAATLLEILHFSNDRTMTANAGYVIVLTAEGEGGFVVIKISLAFGSEGLPGSRVMTLLTALAQLPLMGIGMTTSTRIE